MVCACFANRSPLLPKLSHVARFGFEPLTRALSKLIHLNNPDLCLICGRSTAIDAGENVGLESGSVKQPKKTRTE
ncbi:hypothetical protein E2542_SST08538 [Spatholobus suberectus]|nr:hypothetical protein E2542_SST08538 [Spatholobus suberectus]